MTALHPIIKKTDFSNKNDQGRNFMPKAKFNDIYEDLKKKIEAHAYPYQSLLPSEHELTEVYDCSRNTVRRALREQS